MMEVTAFGRKQLSCLGIKIFFGTTFPEPEKIIAWVIFNIAKRKWCTILKNYQQKINCWHFWKLRLW